MPRYLIERSVPPLTEEEIDAGSRRSIAISDQLGITWIKSYYSAKDGKWYCEYEAPERRLALGTCQAGRVSHRQSVPDRCRRGPRDVSVKTPAGSTHLYCLTHCRYGHLVQAMGSGKYRCSAK